MKLSIEEAVNLCYRGRSNMVKAAKAADVDIDVLKRLLAEKVRRTPVEVNHQLVLPLNY